MSDFLLPRLHALDPYVPGEQPRDRRYIKLNTNESPFPPAPGVLDTLNRETVSHLNLYPDPLAKELREAIADEYGLTPENVFVGNGSDEVLGFSFMAYADETRGVTYPEVSYGFYQVYARLFRAQPTVVPLSEDFTLPVDAFCHQGQMVAIANPNAPTGLALALADVEKIVASNAGSIVLIDEAYVDFGGETCLPLLQKYPNLLIVRTFSKSRSLAGGRLGYALASPEIIDDLNRVKNSFHPYSVNNLTLLAGTIAMRDHAYFEQCVEAVKKQRERSREDFLAMGFKVNPSCTNFLFVSPPDMDGKAYYLALKQRGVLVRFLSQPTLQSYVRVTVGTAEQMQTLMAATADILKEARA